MSILNVNEKDFKAKVIDSQLPVLVDFWAQWCMPCKRLAPIIDEVAKEYDGKLKVAKVDVDEASNIATNFGIMSIPTLIIFKDGKAVDQITGFISKDQIKNKLHHIIKV